jgi:hypothetical protein
MRNGVKEIGWDKFSGKKLLTATRLVKPGQRMANNEDFLKELADGMVRDGGKIIMAQVRHREKENVTSTPRQYGPNEFVKARTDETGSFVYVMKGDGGFFYAENDETYEGDSAKLIPYGENRYVIPDSSDDAAIVKDIVKRTKVYDNLHENVAPVPERAITVQRTDDSEVSAEVTWKTVGFIVSEPYKAGTMIQAVAEGGELITASWLGTHWQETDVPHELQVTEAGEVRIISAAQAAGEVTQSGLDVFKGSSS